MNRAEGVQFVIDAVDDTSSTLSRVRAKFAAFARSAGSQFSNLRNIFSRLLAPLAQIGRHLLWIGSAAVIGGLTAGAYGFARGLLNATMQAQNLRARVQTIFGSGWKQAWDWANTFAKDTPSTLNEVIDAMTRLKSYNIDPFKNLKTIGDFGAAMGRDVLATVEAVADAMMGEWERMKEFGLKRDMLERWMVGRGMKNPFNKAGQIISEQGVQEGLFAYMASKGAGGMNRMMDTIEGKWSNLQDAMSRFFVKIGDIAAPALTKIVSGLTAVVEHLASSGLAESIGNWITNLFSPANVRRVVVFFLNIVDWGKKAFGWLRDSAVWVGEQIAKVFDSIVQAIRDVMPVLGFYYDWEMMRWRDMQNALISGINAAIGGFNLLKGEYWKLRHPLAALRGERLPAEERVQYLQYIANDRPSDVFKRSQERFRFWDSAQGAGRRGLMNALGMPQAPAWGEASLSPEMQGVLNAFDKGFAGSGGAASSAIASATTATAANTARLVAQNESLLSKIYGGGPRAQALVSRLGFGAGAGYGAEQSITIKIEGGDQYTKQLVSDALGQVFRQLRMPNTVRVR